MITVKEMEMLIDIKDGIDELEKLLSAAMGGVGYNAGSPFAKTDKINTLIRYFSPLYVPARDRDLDYDETEIWKVLESDLPNSEKACKLLMIET